MKITNQIKRQLFHLAQEHHLAIACIVLNKATNKRSFRLNLDWTVEPVMTFSAKSLTEADKDKPVLVTFVGRRSLLRLGSQVMAMFGKMGFIQGLTCPEEETEVVAMLSRIPPNTVSLSVPLPAGVHRPTVGCPRLVAISKIQFAIRPPRPQALRQEAPRVGDVPMAQDHRQAARAALRAATHHIRLALENLEDL